MYILKYVSTSSHIKYRKGCHTMISKNEIYYHKLPLIVSVFHLKEDIFTIPF